MIGIAWNCRGIGHPSTIRILKGYIKAHIPSFVFLSESMCTQVGKVEKMTKNLGFHHFELVPTRGRDGDLLLY